MFITRLAIEKYFQSPVKNEFRKVIEYVLNPEIFKKIDNNSFDLSEIAPINNLNDFKVASLLTDEISRQLRWTHDNNYTGYFGVIKNQKNGYNWSYLNLIENQFKYSKVIYAKSLRDLEIKVKSMGHIWYVFDEKLAQKTKGKDFNITQKSVIFHNVPKKESKFSGMSDIEVIKKKKALQEKFLRKNNQPQRMIEKMFI